VAAPKILPRDFFVVALLVSKKWVSSEALSDGGSAENQAKAYYFYFFEKL
jgi:hypothetical protein